MRTGKTVMITTIMLGLMGVTLLSSSPTRSPVNPVKWLQEEILGYFGVQPHILAYAAPLQKDTRTDVSPIHLAKVVGRPAGKPGDTPEDKALEALPKPVPPGQIRKASKAELLNRCHQIPACRAKLQQAKQGKRPTKVLPPGKPGDSPEEKALSTIPKPVPPAPRGKPRSERIVPEDASILLSWLNPFASTPAHAQTAFSVYLTPQNRYSTSPYGRINLYGVAYWGSYYLYQSYISVNSTVSENKPYVYLHTNVPSEGWYFINFEGSRGKGKLRHQNGGPIIETWDFSGQSCNPCDYLTAEYLAAGAHFFYFWADGTNMYFYSASVDSY